MWSSSLGLLLWLPHGVSPEREYLFLHHLTSLLGSVVTSIWLYTVTKTRAGPDPGHRENTASTAAPQFGGKRTNSFSFSFSLPLSLSSPCLADLGSQGQSSVTTHRHKHTHFPQDLLPCAPISKSPGFQELRISLLIFSANYLLPQDKSHFS